MYDIQAVPGTVDCRYKATMDEALSKGTCVKVTYQETFSAPRHDIYLVSGLQAHMYSIRNRLIPACMQLHLSTIQHAGERSILETATATPAPGGLAPDKYC
jgi:hypothetical protein